MKRIIRRAAFAVLALGCAALASAADTRPGAASKAAVTKPAPTVPAYVQAYLPLTYTNGAGKTLLYRLSVPKAALAPGNKEKFPLVMFLHGSGGCGDNNTGQLTDGVPTAAQVLVAEEVQKKYPCFVLAPQCPKRQTWGGISFANNRISVTDQSSEPLDLALELLGTLPKSYAIDTSRLYVTGLSLGGFGTWRAIAQAPDTFAAAVPICGGAHESIVPVLAKSGIPVWDFHGDKDGAVNPDYSRQLVKALKEAKANIRYTEYPGVGHNAWSKAYGEAELLPWLFGQKRAPGK